MSIESEAVHAVSRAEAAFCKFISANDAGKTGGHQAGFYIPKNSIPLMFDSPGRKGENKDRFVTIRWQHDFETQSRFIYYGKGTRNEYRLTRFGKGFPFLAEEHVGDLLVLCHIKDDFYEGFVITGDEETENFLAAFNLSPNDTNQLISGSAPRSEEDQLLSCFRSFIDSQLLDFPPTYVIADHARYCYMSSFQKKKEDVLSRPDKELLHWLDAEYRLFRLLENERYADIISKPFGSVESLIEASNTILNRRKSRAGKSLEHHLKEIFKMFQIPFSAQATTESNKKPDFLFPGEEAYHNPHSDEANLFMLAAKTTCKDRWRQILNEADRIKIKHLFTLQQGISKNQLDEMYRYGVKLVVPRAYLSSFPAEYRGEILTLESFLRELKGA